jgi:hypothetical protein
MRARTLWKLKMTPGAFPIHVAATFEVVKVLVDARPQTLMCMSGNRGRHPLHVAARHSSSSDVVKPLVSRCPRVLHVRTPEGELPAELAWRSGDTDMAKWLEAGSGHEGPTLAAVGSVVGSSGSDVDFGCCAAADPRRSRRHIGPSRDGRSPNDREHLAGTLASVASVATAVTTPMANPRKESHDDAAIQRRRDDDTYQLQQELRIAQEIIQQLEEQCRRQRDELKALRDQKAAASTRNGLPCLNAIQSSSTVLRPATSQALQPSKGQALLQQP